MIETLDPSRRAEILAILTPAFADHPMFPAGTTTETVAAMLTLFLDTFSVPGRSRLFGIRHDGTLACVALCLDARFEPGLPTMLAMFYRTGRILGLGSLWDFIQAFSKRPKYAEPYLELFILGTAPACQKMGLGRSMLRHIYRFAAGQGFRGVILGAAKDSPAYGFYVREGFINDREVFFRGLPIHNMRRENRDTDAGPAQPPEIGI